MNEKLPFAKQLIMDKYNSNVVSTQAVQINIESLNAVAFNNMLKDPITNQQRYLFFGKVVSSVAYDWRDPAKFEYDQWLTMPVQGKLHTASVEGVIHFRKMKIAPPTDIHSDTLTTEFFTADDLLIGGILNLEPPIYTHVLTGWLLKVS